MKKNIKFLPSIALLVIAYVVNKMVGHHVGTLIAGVPMIGSQDMRIAYANAFRNLHNSAMAGMAAGTSPTKAKWYPNRGNVILSQSFLRSEIVLDTTRNTYQFGILNNQITNGQTQIFNTEQRLTLQDIFYVAALGYYFNVQTDANQKYHLYTHPPGTIYNGSNTLTLDALWNAELSLNVNNRVIISAWDMWRHYETPQTQYPTYGTFVGTQQYPVNDEHYGSQSGMFPCEPMWILNGAFDNVMNLTFNYGLATIGVSNGQRMVLIMRGILAQNCSKLMEPGT